MLQFINGVRLAKNGMSVRACVRAFVSIMCACYVYQSVGIYIYIYVCMCMYVWLCMVWDMIPALEGYGPVGIHVAIDCQVIF